MTDREIYLSNLMSRLEHMRDYYTKDEKVFDDEDIKTLEDAIEEIYRSYSNCV